MKPLNELKIALASDHAGFALKKEVEAFLQSQGALTYDYGCHSTESCDYPDFAHPCANAIEKGEADYGVIVCSSGNGICMTANKHQGIRAALCWEVELGRLARQHNNANILGLPANFIPTDRALEIVKTFFATDFEGGRHERRVNKIAIHE